MPFSRQGIRSWLKINTVSCVLSRRFFNLETGPLQTLVAQLSKAIAVIIVNTDKNLLRLPAPPDLDPKSVRIPTVLVSPVFMDAMPKHIFETPPLGRMIMHES
jgi:hypothetical protein